MKKRTKTTSKLFILTLTLLFAALTAAGIVSCNTNNKDETHKQTFDCFDTQKPILSIGSDSEELKIGNYNSIWNYIVDNHENVYISNNLYLTVDKFDKTGAFTLYFGGLNHEASKYPGWNDTFATDSKENITAFATVPKRTWLFFSNDGKDFKTSKVNESLEYMYIKKLKFDGNDRLYVLGYSEAKGHELIRFDKDVKKYTVIHTDNKRTRPGFSEMMPDFDFDTAGNIYITDTVEYRVFVYTNKGTLKQTFSKNMKKNKIEEMDFNNLMEPGRIRKIPNYKEAWKALHGASLFFPSVFGLHIDGKYIYIWTSSRDEDKKYLIDVYDTNFKYAFTTGYYNFVGNNLAYIKNGKLYIPNIGCDDKEYKNSIGRFSIFKLPYKVEVFKKN